MSNRWTQLKRAIDTLRKQFLPAQFHPLGNYADPTRVQAHTRAFLVLGHAEIESNLEEWAKEIARACEVVWKNSGRVTPPLVFLLATFAERIKIPETLIGPSIVDSPQRFADASSKLFQKYYSQIKDNHGIKEKNILALFAPLGLPSSALGSTLLQDLDYLGSLRGTHAHYSAKAVHSVLDPETEYKRLTQLVADLLVLDNWFVSYKRRVR